MSQQPSSFTSASFSYSSSSSNVDGQVSGHQSAQSSVTDASGTRVTSTSQNLGEPEVRETRHFDSQGRQLEGSGSAASRIQDVTDEAQAKRDAEYEERMEDE